MKPYYRSGVTGVDHRNIDAAGDGHPFGDEPKEWKADIRPFIRQVADDMYDSWYATVREYLANAETACLKVEQYLESPEESPYDDLTVEEGYTPRVEVEWDRSKQKLTISDNGIGMAAAEVDQVFRHIGRSAARDLGAMSGAFGMGSLSFPKFIGTGNSTMIMLSNSRLNGDNAAYLVSLAGIEPIRGSLDDDEYGTTFKLDQKEKGMDVRDAVTMYANWMRVPVIYRELDENGSEVMNEDYGDAHLYDSYSSSSYCEKFEVPGAFAAYMCTDANGKTLLLSMEIDRNRSTESNAPHDYDVRILDESGRIIESSNGNTGRIPVPRPEYEQMLLDGRPDSITTGLLSVDDVTAYRVQTDEYDYAMEEDILAQSEALPIAEYVTRDQIDHEELGAEVVVSGPHSGREIVEIEEWGELPEGRASEFVPEDEVEPYDIATETGDLRLPQPTTDRSTLKENDVFWEYIDNYFNHEFESTIRRYRDVLNNTTEDPVEVIEQMEPQNADRIIDQK